MTIILITIQLKNIKYLVKYSHHKKPKDKLTAFTDNKDRSLGRASDKNTSDKGVPTPQRITILKPRLVAVTGCQYVYVGFSQHNKIPHSSAYTISQKAIWFRHPGL